MSSENDSRVNPPKAEASSTQEFIGFPSMVLSSKSDSASIVKNKGISRSLNLFFVGLLFLIIGLSIGYTANSVLDQGAPDFVVCDSNIGECVELDSNGDVRSVLRDPERVYRPWEVITPPTNDDLGIEFGDEDPGIISDFPEFNPYWDFYPKEPLEDFEPNNERGLNKLDLGMLNDTLGPQIPCVSDGCL